MNDLRHKLLVVDLGGVAAKYRPDRRLLALAEATGLDAASITAELFESGLDSRAETGDYTPEPLVELILERLGHRLQRNDLIAAWSQCFEPATTTLDFLAQQPLPRALFTNNGPMVDLCLEGPLRGLAQEFETVICSWHIGAIKPARAAFDRAADRLNREPAELVLIDDSQANITGARAAGWNATHFTSVAELHSVLAAND